MPSSYPADVAANLKQTVADARAAQKPPALPELPQHTLTQSVVQVVFNPAAPNDADVGSCPLQSG
jgi:hypothetical protein